MGIRGVIVQPISMRETAGGGRKYRDRKIAELMEEAGSELANTARGRRGCGATRTSVSMGRIRVRRTSDRPETGCRARTATPLQDSGDSPTIPVMDHLSRIAIDPEVRFGKPCVRGTRITVGDVLSYLASGMSEEDILKDFPQLTRDDIRACLAFAAERERRILSIPAA
jgi:uncharacterized protein (DUF433 family)